MVRACGDEATACAHLASARLANRNENATDYPVSLFLALYTTPYVLSPADAAVQQAKRAEQQ